MLNIIKQNKIIFIVLVVVIAGFAWFGLSDRAIPTQGLLTTETGGQNMSVADQEIVRLLLDMRSIRLDGSLFEDPAFRSLRDFGRSIIAEPVGRRNPFAPAENPGQPSDADTVDAVFSQ